MESERLESEARVEATRDLRAPAATHADTAKTADPATGIKPPAASAGPLSQRGLVALQLRAGNAATADLVRRRRQPVAAPGATMGNATAPANEAARDGGAGPETSDGPLLASGGQPGTTLDAPLATPPAVPPEAPPTDVASSKTSLPVGVAKSPAPTNPPASAEPRQQLDQAIAANPKVTELLEAGPRRGDRGVAGPADGKAEGRGNATRPPAGGRNGPSGTTGQRRGLPGLAGVVTPPPAQDTRDADVPGPQAPASKPNVEGLDTRGPVDTPEIPAASFAPVDTLKIEAAAKPKRGVTSEDLVARLEEERAVAAQLVDGFVETRRARAAEVRALEPELVDGVAQARARSQQSIREALAAQTSAVRVGIGQALAVARNNARTARSRVEREYASSVESIRASTARSRRAITSSAQSANERTNAAETAQRAEVGRLYTAAEAQFRSAAGTAGTLATTRAAERARTYRAGKIHREDSFLDGHLTDNRCEAQAEAAEKVGAGYREELVKEGDKQVAQLRTRRPTDDESVTRVATDSRRSLAELQQVSIRSLEDAEQQALTNARKSKDQLLSQINQTLNSTDRSLRQHEQSQLTALRRQADQRAAAVRDAGQQAIASIRTAIRDASAGVDTALAGFVTELNRAEVPELGALDGSLAETGEVLDSQLGQLDQGLRGQVAQAKRGISDAEAAAVTALGEVATAALAAARETGRGAQSAFSMIGSEGATALRSVATAHSQAAESNATGFASGSERVVSGVTSSYAQLNRSFEEGASRNAQSVRDGLTQVVQRDMPGVITDEARKARAQVQPRWKSVLKWVIILAIVLVVAIVLGPMVIGAVTGAAAALGASAGVAGIVGMVVGGALVGAATSAATTVVDNAFSGRALTTGLGTAIAMGALGGALGGAASGLLAGPMQGMSALARYGTQLAVDVVLDTGLNLASGNFTWENFAAGLLMSALVNGVTAHPRVQAIQHGFSSRGYGAGFSVGQDVHTAVTGRGGPGSAGTINVDTTHINVGDTQAGGPHAGKWNMKGGGHNPAEIRARAAADSYSNTRLGNDPITGVSVDQFGRPNPASPGGAQTTRKSLFPESMGRPEIDTAARTTLEQALAGAPQTTHTPPVGSQNGSFAGVVVTPDGHPIRVQGYYTRDSAGNLVIKTFYPETTLGSGTAPPTFHPVPGSRVSVPGTIVTPPNYSYAE